MPDVALEKSVWDLLFAAVFVDPTLVLLSQMDANIWSEWIRLSPDKFCVGFPSRNAIMLSFSPFSTRTSVITGLDFPTAREEYWR